MRRVFAVAVFAGALLFGLGGVAIANPTPGPVTHPGQHGQDCADLGGTVPGGGNSAVSPGSPFYEGHSSTQYAGEKANNSQNGQASQYDVACFQQSVH
jgi:hypothetical protein